MAIANITFSFLSINAASCATKSFYKAAAERTTKWQVWPSFSVPAFDSEQYTPQNVNSALIKKLTHVLNATEL